MPRGAVKSKIQGWINPEDYVLLEGESVRRDRSMSNMLQIAVHFWAEAMRAKQQKQSSQESE